MAAVSQDKLNINSRQIPRRSLKDLPTLYFLIFFLFQCGAPLDKLPLVFDFRLHLKVMCDTIALCFPGLWLALLDKR
jgi:hypothetical protein